ncbi:MAG: MBL fold metallo-hydrolase [Rhodobacteraceae bacterium]|nr:MBL fold metallo-hydrolase [Paracoccaceae bacterium]
MKINWCGHSAFLVASENGLVRLLFDPYIPGSWNGALKYAPIRETCDAVFVSHKHDGHFGFNTINGNRALIRGHGKFWVQNVHVNGVQTWHDDCKGQERGDNTAFAFRLDGINIAHMGDIGHKLDDRQLEELGDVDVLMIPCGGHSTVDAEGAFGIVQQLQPGIVLPMHYKTDKLDAVLEEVDAFARLFSKVERVDGSLELAAETLPEDTTLMIMTPKY